MSGITCNSCLYGCDALQSMLVLLKLSSCNILLYFDHVDAWLPMMVRSKALSLVKRRRCDFPGRSCIECIGEPSVGTYERQAAAEIGVLKLLHGPLCS